MHIQRLMILLTFLFALIDASNVFANPHHHHHNGAVESELASPFEKKKEGKSLHCLLNNHYRDGFCPHKKSDGTVTQKISVECHGKEAGTLPTTFFQIDYLQNNIFSADLHFLSSEMFIGKFFATKQYRSLQDPPPKVL
jgi:hypothetical protein